MSFHFNLSSSSSGEEEDDDDEELEWRRERDQFRRTILNNDDDFGDGKGDVGGGDEEDYYRSQSDDGGDDDEVDWEDGHDDDVGEDDENDGTVATSSSASSAITGRRLPTEAVTIDFSPSSTSPTKDDDEKKRKKRKRVRTRRKLTDVPPGVSRLVIDLHRSHLLALTARCVHLSSLITMVDDDDDDDHPSRQEMLGLALSMVPERFHEESDQHPTLDLAREFATWFFDLVNDVEGRRDRMAAAHRAAGAPQPPPVAGRARRRSGNRGVGGGRRRGPPPPATPPACAKSNDATSFFLAKGEEARTEGCAGIVNPTIDRLAYLLRYLSPSLDEDPHRHDDVVELQHPGSITPLEKTLLFLAVARSLRWRVRYVLALVPISRDLTVDHPLLRDDGLDGAMEMVARVLRAANELGLLHNTDDDRKRPAVGGNGSGRKRRRRLDVQDRQRPGTIDLTGTGTSSSDGGDGESEGHPDGTAVKERMGSAAGPATPTPTRALHDDCDVALSWVEVLCHRRRPQSSTTAKASPTSSSKGDAATPAPEWVHVDVHNELFDRPQLVEGMLSRMAAVAKQKEERSDDHRRGGGRRNGRRHARRGRRGGSNRRKGGVGGGRSAKTTTRVSYVVGVEHRCHPGGGGGVAVARPRLTDVTPRYANRWSESLRLRGATGKQIAEGGGRCVDVWWRETVRRINGLGRDGKKNKNKKKKESSTGGQRSGDEGFRPPATAAAAAKTNCTGGGVHDAIVLDSSDDDDADEEKKESCSDGMNESTSTTHHLRHPHSSSEEDDEDEDETTRHETAQFRNSVEREAIPTSKNAFNNHPTYVIPSVLKANEVLCPGASGRVCGMFKGELVYRRSDVSVALPAKKWLYEGRRVRDGELARPVKTVRARKRPTSKRFRALKSYGVGTPSASGGDGCADGLDTPCEEDDGMQRIYGRWQTDKWRPKAVGPDEDIPVNEYRNVEKALINPGLVHLEEEYRISVVAKKLGIPYAPCFLGFEGHGGNRTPKIRGIVVHEHNAELLREAHAEWESQALEQEHAKHQRDVCMRWKRLVVGLLTKVRLEREYGDQK